MIDEANIESHGMGYGRRVAGQGPELEGGPPGPHAADGRTRQEPSVGHHLVAGQRGRQRRQLRGHATTGSNSAIPPGPSSTNGPAWTATPTSTARCTPRSTTSSSTPAEPQDAAADPLRVRPRHGQQRRQPAGLLGRDREPHAILQGGFIWDWVDQGLLANGPARLSRSPTGPSRPDARVQAASTAAEGGVTGAASTTMPDAGSAPAP